MSDWKPEGATIHDRLLELINRYIDTALQHTRGMQGMMLRDGATRMYPRIESTIRNLSEDRLKEELQDIGSQIQKVLGQNAKQKHNPSQAIQQKQSGGGRKRGIRTQSAILQAKSGATSKPNETVKSGAYGKSGANRKANVGVKSGGHGKASASIKMGANVNAKARG